MTRYNLTDPRVQQMAEEAKKGFPILPDGKHLMRVTSATFKVVTNKESGSQTDALDIDLIVVPGEPCEHMTCRDTLFFSEKALGRVLLCLTAFGVKDAEMAAFDPTDEKCRNLIVGRTAIVETKQKPDKTGKMWANPTYAAYSVAHVGSIEEMKKNREAGAASPAPSGLPADKLGALPFVLLAAIGLIAL